jgi:hypothetical protein
MPDLLVVKVLRFQVSLKMQLVSSVILKLFVHFLAFSLF